jgi:hypothetical protein
VLVRISKSKRKSEVTSLLKTSNSDRTFRKTYDRLETADHINKETAILIWGGEKFVTENEIFRREIEDLREVIFEEKCKRKRRKALNFYKEDEIDDQILFFNPAKLLGREKTAREKAAKAAEKRLRKHKKRAKWSYIKPKLKI